MAYRSCVGGTSRRGLQEVVISMVVLTIVASACSSNVMAQGTGIVGGWKDSSGGRVLLARLQQTEQNIGQLENRVPPLNQRVQTLIDRVFALESPSESPEKKPEEEGFKEVTFRPPLAYASNKPSLSLIFENGRVTILDIPAIVKVANQHWDRTNIAGTWTVQVPAGHFDITYESSLKGTRLFRTSYKVVRKSGQTHQGETVEEFNRSDSEVNSALIQADPAKIIISCVVYPDSFEMFRTVRQLAWKEKLDLGWTPFNSGGSIYLGSGTTTGQ